MQTPAPRFGTDGIRGEANIELSPEVALALGRAVIEVLGGDLLVVGSDTRQSGPMLEGALAAGAQSAGADVELLGVVPTPTVAWASVDRNAPAAMISASHNPFGDNGIKIFAAGGRKLDDAIQGQIQDRYLELFADSATGWKPAAEVGIRRPTSGVDGWVESIVASVAPKALQGVELVLDCAHGAAFEIGADPFRRLGASVSVIGNQPDGRNINQRFGSTSTEALQSEVRNRQAHMGLALDGDADRLIAVDERGNVVDGDRVIGLLASDWARTGRLKGNTVVVTVMTNLGFHRSMADRGIEVVSTGVGDRYVLEAMEAHGYTLGGEQSGHVICRDLATTGDGVLAGVQLLDTVLRSRRPLSELATEFMTRVPQVLKNVRLPGPVDDPIALVADQVAELQARFGSDGRVLVRPSGTEPLLRIMVEHLDSSVAESACDELVLAAQEAF